VTVVNPDTLSIPAFWIAAPKVLSAAAVCIVGFGICARLRLPHEAEGEAVAVVGALDAAERPWPFPERTL